MADKKTRLVLADFSGGRNGVDSPLGPAFAANQVTDAVNGDWYHTSGFRKRNGSSNLDTQSIFSNKVSWMGRHVPTTKEADAELWAIDDSASPPGIARLDNSTTWSGPSSIIAPTIGSNTWEFTSASLNGKFFFAFPQADNRHHVYDPTGDILRACGLDIGADNGTTGNTGSGSYAATIRYYRRRFAIGTRVLSEPTTAGAFTPSGSGSGVSVTRGTPPTNADFWYVEASTDGVTFYVISSSIAIGTTTYTDSAAPSTYSTVGFLSPLTGTFTLQMPYRFIATDQNRQIGFGSYRASDPQHRVEFSAIVGTVQMYGSSTTNCAEERVNTNFQYYVDLDENDSGVPTGLVGPVWGNFYPFKSRQMWELAPTGSTDEPYRRTAITKELGCVGPHAACRGEDANGNPCLYFMSHRGVYRYSPSGLQYIGRGIEDLIIGPTSVMNMAATKVIAHMVYHQDRRQLWVWFATGASNDPDTLCVFDVRANGGNGGWFRVTGQMASARCSVMFASSIGATMGFSLVPYIGLSTTNNRIVKCDDTAVNQDSGVSYQASLTTKPIEAATRSPIGSPGGSLAPGHNITVGDLMILAPAATGVTLTATVTPDFGAQPAQTGTALLTAAGSETRVSRRMDGSALSGAQFMQVTIGDAAAANNNWSFDRLIVPVSAQEAVSA